MYRDEVGRLEDLQGHEQLALGGLIRVLIRLDGSFSEEEEAHIEQVGADLGTAEELWRVISRSAQELQDDDAIREAARAVERPGARRLIRDALVRIAQAETIEPAERALLEWVDEAWELSER